MDVEWTFTSWMSLCYVATPFLPLSLHFNPPIILSHLKTSSTPISTALKLWSNKLWTRIVRKLFETKRSKKENKSSPISLQLDILHIDTTSAVWLTRGPARDRGGGHCPRRSWEWSCGSTCGLTWRSSQWSSGSREEYPCGLLPSFRCDSS